MLDLKLAEALEPVIPENEQVLGAFVAMRVKGAWVVILHIPTYFVFLIVTSSFWYSIPPALVVGIIGHLKRERVTIVRTDRNVLVIENGWRKKPRVGASLTTYPSGAIAHALKGGDSKFRVDDENYWVDGLNRDEARRLAKMPGTLRR